MDEIDEFAKFLREYIEATQADPQMRGMWLLVLDLEVERIRLETLDGATRPALH